MIQDLLANPFVLQCAWEKLTTWYKTEWAPEPEWTEWQKDPWPRMIEVAHALASDDEAYRCAPMPLVPYPKKGAEVRHYVMPSVRDQFAHLVFAVLLAPFIERRMPNVSLGNRWYRGVRREFPTSNESSGQWKKLPFSLSDRSLFDPYKRAHGLFRRLAAWTAEGFTRGQFDTPRIGNSADRPAKADYPAAQLPYVSNAFRLERPVGDALCYARLDLAKAFPSFHRQDVRDALSALLRSSYSSRRADWRSRWGINESSSGDDLWRSLFGPRLREDALEAPWRRLVGSQGRAARLLLATRWMDLLDQAEYQTQGQGFDLSNVLDADFHPSQERYRSRFGLPTGLAVSPMLLNVVLRQLDLSVLRHLEETSNDGALRGSYLRFADDIILFGVDEPALRDLLLKIRSEIAGYKEYGPELRPKLNEAKVRPESVRQWLLAESDTLTISLEPGDLIDEEHRREFVTDLVQHMSALAHETILERYSRLAFDRINQLHELARWDIQDQEVRPDTRLAFAVSKLSRAWIPSNVSKELVQAADGIRQTVRIAIRNAPWKFRLWRAAILAAVRVDPEVGRPSQAGISWLEKQLEQIAVGGDWEDGWIRADNLEKPKTKDYQSTAAFRKALRDWRKWNRGESTGLRIARVSFLRASFWRTLADCITQLARAIDLVSQGEDLPKDAWYTATVGHQALENTLKDLLDSERWAKVLYGAATPDPMPPWEREAIRTVFAAIVAAMKDVTGSGEPYFSVHPTLARLSGLDLQPSEIDAFLKYGDEAQQSGGIRGRLAIMSDHMATPSSIFALELTLDQAFREFQLEWDQAFAQRHRRPELFAAALWFYHRLRTVLLRYQAAEPWLLRLVKIVAPSTGPRTAESLHSIMWRAPGKRRGSRARLDPTSVPALGLSTPWAIKIFADLTLDKRLDPHLPLEASIEKAWLHTFRLERESTLRQDLRCHGENLLPKEAGARVAGWQLPTVMPPHPAAFIPGWLKWGKTRSRRWQATLALTLAMTGTEDVHEKLLRKISQGLPWSENLRLRCNLLLPRFVWSVIDQATGWRSTRPVRLEAEFWLAHCRDGSELMEAGLGEVITTVRIHENFPVVDLDFYGLHTERTASIRLEGKETLTSRVPAFELLDEAKLSTDLKVRLAQISAKPLWQKQGIVWPHKRDVCEPMRDQMIHALAALAVDPSRRPPDLIAFPEASLHVDDATSAARLTAEHGTGMLSGIYWRALAPAVRPSLPMKKGATRYFVNEAILSVPHLSRHHAYAPYVFRIRKPRPAHIELGVQAAITKHRNTPGKWIILPGKEWLRFHHPRWGPFAVAICSDLLDIGPWARLKGRLLHVLLVAWNPDVPLYDSMTWTRAYELFVNLAAVNHGEYGGSLAWTPKHEHHKSLFTVKGANQLVTSDVLLPVKALAKAQKGDGGILAAENQALAEEFLNLRSGRAKKVRKNSEFKAPPVSYRRYW